MKAAQPSGKSENKSPKKTYAKPVITRVQLVAGEAVLATCKFGPTRGLDLCTPELSCEWTPRS